MFPIKDYLKALKENFGVDSELKPHKNGKDAYITLIGPSPKIVKEAANQLLKSFSPMNVRFIGKQQQKSIKEIFELGLLDKWDEQFKVEHELSEDRKTGEFFKLEIFGDQISQGLFMNQILNYSDDFNSRYKLVPLPNNMSFLFKKDRIGANFLQNLNKELYGKIELSFVNHENSIEIYAKPKTYINVEDLTNKIAEFIKSHTKVFIAKAVSEAIYKCCVYCEKQGNQTFSICGHSFCSTCLSSKTKNNCNAGRTVECGKCQTPVSIRDIKACFTPDELSKIAQIAASFYFKNNTNSQFSICPSEACSAIREKNLGYSVCVCCGKFSCTFCGEENSLHEGRTCKQYQEILKNHFDLNDLFNKAIKFTYDNWDKVQLGPIERIDKNIGLELGCPSMQKFGVA